MRRTEVFMAHTYHDLKEMTIAELRELAKGIQDEAVQGYSQMNKERLLPALCRALKIDMAEHHMAKGIDKPAIKARMRELKAKRTTALEGGDHEQLKNIRRQLHHLNRQIRAHLD
jgi:DNA-binding IclR family transcriptional regulator